MLLLAIPALIIGVVSSLVLIVVMKVASVLQTLLWNALPAGLGVTADSPADRWDADVNRYCGGPGDPF